MLAGVAGIHPNLEVFDRAGGGRVRIGPGDWSCSTCYAPVPVQLIDSKTGRLPCGHDLGLPPGELRVDVNEWTVRWLMARAVTPTLAAALQRWGSSRRTAPVDHDHG